MKVVGFDDECVLGAEEEVRLQLSGWSNCVREGQKAPASLQMESQALSSGTGRGQAPPTSLRMLVTAGKLPNSRLMPQSDDVVFLGGAVL